MTTGEKIYAARKKAGMTQEELADRLGVSRQAVSKWESDAAYPETDKIVELCKLFALSADDLLLGAESAPRKDPATEERHEENKERKPLFDRNELHFEYVSKTRIGGLPLVHVNFGLGHYRAKGIFAIGNVATGLIAIGFVSVGLIGWGLLSLGLFAFCAIALGLLFGAGAVATGVLAFGGVAIGVMCFGGVTVGYIAVGGCAVGHVALGGYAQGFYAVGQTGASGTHAFVMPEEYENLCAYANMHIHGWLGEFIKSVARNLCG